jgi:outer membrane cobalamin receptor
MKIERISAAALLLSLCSFSAFAAQPATPADTAAQSPAQTQPDGDKPPPCIEQTGTRFPTRKGHCVNATGEVVTREELEGTGATNAGDALRRTTPSVR